MTDDESETPEFPWPMAIPAAVWVTHGLFLLVMVAMIAILAPDPYIGRSLDLCAYVTLVPSALLFIVGGYGVVTGRANMVGAFVAGLYCFVYMVVCINNREIDPFILMTGAILMINIFITIFNDDAWRRWANHRRYGPRPL